MVKIKIVDETKHDKFVRLATKRTQNVLDALRILGNCSNLHTYEYSKDEVEKVFKSIKGMLEEVKQKFNYNLSNGKIFKLWLGALKWNTER